MVHIVIGNRRSPPSAPSIVGRRVGEISINRRFIEPGERGGAPEGTGKRVEPGGWHRLGRLPRHLTRETHAMLLDGYGLRGAELGSFQHLMVPVPPWRYGPTPQRDDRDEHHQPPDFEAEKSHPPRIPASRPDWQHGKRCRGACTEIEGTRLATCSASVRVRLRTASEVRNKWIAARTIAKTVICHGFAVSFDGMTVARHGTCNRPAVQDVRSIVYRNHDV